jgi:DNA-binding transcriptional regulator YdaS (Cro superfamily)
MSDRMIPADLRAIRDSLNPGGQSKLARMLGWHHSTVWRKLNGKSRITPSDEMAIKQALVQLPCRNPQ